MTRPLEPDESEEAPAWRPRPFVLARSLQPGDKDEAIYPDDVVTWGLAFADHAMTYFRDPVTHHCDQGRFDSADRARRRYSRGEAAPVRLVWLQ